jgi:ZIP family zinc transporter
VLEAALWGFVTAGSLLLGAAIAVVARPGNRVVGLTIAFGSGALIAAVAYELVLEAFETSFGFAATGFALGAIAFYTGDWLIDRRGGHGRKKMSGPPLAGVASAIVLGTVLDGIPESFVLGASLQTDGTVPTAVAVGVFVSNVPESLSATAGLLGTGWSRGRLFAMWGAVVAASVVSSILGWVTLDAMPGGGGAFALAFAGGALLVMLTDTLMPEAFELGGREAGLFVALGFALGFALS